MSIQFSCYSCGRDFDVPENMAGTKARCQTCGAIVTVPRTLTPLAELTPLDDGPVSSAASYAPLAGGSGWTTHEARQAGRPQTLADLQAAQRGAAGGGVPKAVWIAAIAGGGVILATIAALFVLSAIFGGSDEEGANADTPVATGPSSGIPGAGQGPTSSNPFMPSIGPSGFGPDPATNRSPAGGSGQTAGAPQTAGTNQPAPEPPPEDPATAERHVRECYEQYTRALVNRDGHAAKQCVDGTSITWYGQMQQLAIAASRAQLQSRPVCDKMMVLTLRHQLPLEQLRKMSGEEIFVHGVQQGWVGGSAGDHQVRAVQVVGNTAQVVVTKPGGRGGAMLPFRRERGTWRLNLLSLLQIANEGIRLGAMLSGKSENELIVDALQTTSGRSVSAGIWEPLDPSAKLDPSALATISPPPALNPADMLPRLQPPFAGTEPTPGATIPQPDTRPPPDRESPRGSNETLPTVPNLAEMARAARERASRGSADSFGPDARGAEERNAGGADWTPWQATVDPPAQPVEYGKGKLSIPVAGQVVFPDRPSNFVLVSGRDERRRDVWQVYDLRTGKEIGKPVRPDQFAQVTLFSPDGRYAATRLHVSGSQAYGVWSFVSGEFLREITPGDSGFSAVSFAGPHQLLSIESKSDTSVVRIWDLTSGEKIREFSMFSDRNHRSVRDAVILTPGARYLCSIEGDRLAAYDVTNGNCVGHARLPGAADSCSALTFSHDGAELAALLNFASAQHLVCWDFATGAVTLDHAYDNSGGPSRWNASLQWLRDKSGLLCQGSILLDRQTGIEVWTFPEDRSNPRRMLDLKRMLAVVDSRAGRTLTYVDLPDKDLEKAVETIRGGGQAVDSVLPKLVQANVLSARVMTLPNGFTDWAAKLDPAGAAAGASDRDLLIGKEGESLKAALFAAPSAGRVVVQKTARRAAGTGGRSAEVAFVERYDVKSGQKSPDIPLPLVYDLLDVSPSGDHVLVGFRQGTGEYDRLDVIRISPREHIVGWRPYDGEKTPESRYHGENPKHVRRAALLDDAHVLTVNCAGKLTIWEMPDCRAVYSFQDFGSPVAFSPGRQYMVGVHSQEIRLFETATGECRGDLKTPHTGVRLRRAAFRPDGGELVAVVDSGFGKDLALATWSMETGELKEEFPLPPDVLHWSHTDAAGSLEWRGNRHLLLDQQYLIDVKNRAVVWQYHLPYGCVVAARSPDQRTWFCAPRENVGGGPLFLVAAETPSASARMKTEFTTLEKQLVLGPGMSIQLNVQLGGDLQAKVVQVLTEALQARGIQVRPNAPLQFVLTAQQGSTGTQIEVSSFGRPRNQPNESFAQQQISCSMAIKDAAGKALWSYERRVQMRDFGFVNTKEGEQAQSQLNREMQNSFESTMSSGDFIRNGLPTYIFGELRQILAGASTLTFRGETPPPPPPKPLTP